MSEKDINMEFSRRGIAGKRRAMWHRRIDELVAAAPELNDDHRAKLAALLGGGASR